jgi:hypothetical protein
MATRSDVDVQGIADLQPGSYIGLYVGDRLMYTGVLKDIGVMRSGRKVVQVLLVKNLFQRNWPEIHFDPDIRPVTIEDVKAEVRQLKSNLQRHIHKMENDVDGLLTEQELHNIIG